VLAGPTEETRLWLNGGPGEFKPSNASGTPEKIPYFGDMHSLLPQTFSKMLAVAELLRVDAEHAIVSQGFPEKGGRSTE
jgi:hypothetical protein